jgi:hypothetical protein
LGVWREMKKQNCWEFKNCGREPGGKNAKELGVCPAALEKAADCMNCGKNGGRACWAIVGTLCGGKVQGSFALKTGDCLKCDFYERVKAEEGYEFGMSIDVLKNPKKPYREKP